MLSHTGLVHKGWNTLHEADLCGRGVEKWKGWQRIDEVGVLLRTDDDRRPRVKMNSCARSSQYTSIVALHAALTFHYPPPFCFLPTLVNGKYI